ncbi:unnamed protein product [Owenia fusiformis]|uniref:Uncharacterized protein n=1 Tax=Owenia fusiformis TaxID=6347 RepID=A0A8J1Y0U6_OWEFU|nr:unnamed protein product [Owenia fusiformis]
MVETSTYLLDTKSIISETYNKNIATVNMRYDSNSDFDNVINDSLSNISIEESLFIALGPRRQSLLKVIPITVVYCIIFITGIVGNICTCLVVARNKYMQTATNYYLFNLAIADLLMLVLGLPQEVYSFWSSYPWIFGESFCVIRTMAAETSTYASILTITAFTIERYVAICHPLKCQTLSSLSRAVKVIVLLWIVSAILSIPIVILFGIVYKHDRNDQIILDSATCNIKEEYDHVYKHAFEVATFLFFLAPMTVITVLYVLIGLAIRRSSLSRAGSDSSTGSGPNGTELRAVHQSRARRSVLKMLEDSCPGSCGFIRVHGNNGGPAVSRSLPLTVAVVVAFFVCWAPFHAQRLMVIYVRNWTPRLMEVQGVLYYISGVLYYVSSTINPILYNIMSLKFRQAFICTILKPCRRRRKRPQFVTYRFNKSHTDTNVTMVVGYSPDNNNRNRPQGGSSQEPGATRSHSRSNSEISGTSLRMIDNENQDPLGGIELEQLLDEMKQTVSGTYHCLTDPNIVPNGSIHSQTNICN